MFYNLKVIHPYQMKSAYLLNSLFVLLVSSGVGLCKSGSDDFMVGPHEDPANGAERSGSKRTSQGDPAHKH